MSISFQDQWLRLLMSKYRAKNMSEIRTVSKYIVFKKSEPIPSPQNPSPARLLPSYNEDLMGCLRWHGSCKLGVIEKIFV
jgi:hypothetical protein